MYSPLPVERSLDFSVPKEHMLLVTKTTSAWRDTARVDTRITFWNSRDKRDSLFRPKILARFSRVKISSESHRQKFRSGNREKWVSLWNFVARIASYESRRKKFRNKTRFSRVSQTNFVARLAGLANRNFVARLTRIITNFNSGVLRESCENFKSNSNFSQWIMTLLVCESRKCETHKLRNSQAWQYIAFSLSCETRETCETRTDIFARASLIFHKILARKIAKRDSLSTVDTAGTWQEEPGKSHISDG